MTNKQRGYVTGLIIGFVSACISFATADWEMLPGVMSPTGEYVPDPGVMIWVWVFELLLIGLFTLVGGLIGSLFKNRNHHAK